ncbi:MAG TPA: hypothetical protein VIR05_05660 [Luteimonas sp.]
MSKAGVVVLRAECVFGHGSTPIDTDGASPDAAATLGNGRVLLYSRSSMLIRGKNCFTR